VLVPALDGALVVVGLLGLETTPPPLDELVGKTVAEGPADTERDWVTQVVLELAKTVKVADWPTAPVLSRKFRKPEVPAARLTFHVTESADVVGNDTRAVPLG